MAVFTSSLLLGVASFSLSLLTLSRCRNCLNELDEFLLSVLPVAALPVDAYSGAASLGFI
jgi:hypothetical protein